MIKTVLAYYKPYWRLLALDLLCAVGVAATALALPLCARYITETLLADPAPGLLARIGGMGAVMVGLLALQTLCNFFVDFHGHMMGARMESDMRRDLFDHFQTLSFGFYDTQRTGHLMSRLTHDLFALSELFHHGPEDLLIALLKFTGAFVILLYIDVALTLVLFLFVPPMLAYALHFNRRMNAALARGLERVGDVNAQVEDSLAGIRVVKSFGNEDVEAAKFAYHNARFVESRRDVYHSEAYFYGGMGAFTGLFTVVVIVFGAVRIAAGSLGVADLVTFLLYVGSLTEPIQRAVNFARLYQDGITGFNRFMDMMQVRPAIEDPERPVALERVRGQVTFDGVGFAYESAPVLHDLSFDVQAGEYAALVGASGAGKTTLCSLIPRFYDVTSGEIRLDGVPVRDLPQRFLRRQIGVVQQDVYLFAGTVAENIAYGRPGAERDDIIEAAKQAYAHAFITALPHGYDTPVGQRGVRLSGGQKQRISIARVFLKNPPVIIFDEATSALDTESERAVGAAMARLRAERTLIVVAHRLSTIRDADCIYVLDAGELVERGTHAELLARGGVYARLHTADLRNISVR